MQTPRAPTSSTIPVSLIIPSYNSRRFLSECVASIGQERAPAEVIIVDDCSTDGSDKLAVDLANAHSNIRVLRTARNSGAAEARRLGISAAKFEWIALLDADDYLSPGAVADAFSTAVAERADMCIWDLWRFDTQRSWRSHANPEYLPITGRDAVLMSLPQWRIHPLGVARRSLYLDAYSGFNVRCMNADELITRIVFSRANAVVGCGSKYFYRHYGESSSQRLDATRITILRSHLWLLGFSRAFPGAPVGAMIASAVRDAWFFWRARHVIGVDATRIELRDFLFGLGQICSPIRELWRRPKLFLAWSLLRLHTALPVVKQ